MAVGDYEVIGRATRILRAAPEPGWLAIESDVVAAVRGTPRGGWPLDVEDPEPGAAPGVLRVSDLVLTNLLSRALRDDPDYTVVDLSAESNHGVLQEISIELSCRYLADVTAAAQRVRARSAAVIADVIGAGDAVAIAVTVTDVHR